MGGLRETVLRPVSRRLAGPPHGHRFAAGAHPASGRAVPRRPASLSDCRSGPRRIRGRRPLERPWGALIDNCGRSDEWRDCRTAQGLVTGRYAIVVCSRQKWCDSAAGRAPGSQIPTDANAGALPRRIGQAADLARGNEAAPTPPTGTSHQGRRRITVTDHGTATRVPVLNDSTLARASWIARRPERIPTGGSSPARRAARTASTWRSSVLWNIRPRSLK